MRTVTALEAKTKFSALLARVIRGEEIVITRHDQPVARMIREVRKSSGTTQQAVDGLRAVQELIRARTKGRAKLSKREARSAINAGRR